MNSLTVVLNIRSLSVPELINRSRFYVQRINDNSTIFVSCVATAGKITLAANELHVAHEAAVDGGKTKFREKEDKHKKLLNLLPTLAHQVGYDADGDESIVHLAGMEVKRKGMRSTPEFVAGQGENSGTVKLKVKARYKTMYKWQYATDPALVNWIDGGISTGCKKVIDHLSSGVYWFRVVFMDNDGEHNGEAIKFAVT